METRCVRARKALSADGLLSLIRDRFDHVTDPRRGVPNVPLGDALMAAFAMFSLKEPSLLAFDREHRGDPNLQAIYRIGHVPCDTSMREILDPVDWQDLIPGFTDVFRCLQRGKALETFVYWNNCYLLSVDGTQYFSSTKVHCDSCQEKHSHTGVVTYSHSAVAAVLVHPEHAEVIPLAPEPIIRQDGKSKNDCERSAARRLLAHIRQEHPHLGFIVVEDGLSSNGPHVRDLKKYGMHFILGAKPGDHPYLFAQVEQRVADGTALTLEIRNPATGKHCTYIAVRDVPLNESHPDLLVNFVMLTEQQGEQTKVFSWITELPLEPTCLMLPLIARGGRCRWKIENETFNTLKNQGYHFEHNYGHGYQNLSAVLMQLMMLAFLVDQAQQIACPLFRAALAKMESRRRLWRRMRALFISFAFQCMADIYRLIISGHVQLAPLPLPTDSS